MMLRFHKGVTYYSGAGLRKKDVVWHSWLPGEWQWVKISTQQCVYLLSRYGTFSGTHCHGIVRKKTQASDLADGSSWMVLGMEKAIKEENARKRQLAKVAREMEKKVKKCTKGYDPETFGTLDTNSKIDLIYKVLMTR